MISHSFLRLVEYVDPQFRFCKQHLHPSARFSLHSVVAPAGVVVHPDDVDAGDVAVHHICVGVPSIIVIVGLDYDGLPRYRPRV